MNLKKITTTAVKMDTTPFSIGRKAVVVNLTAGALTLQGSDDGVSYSTLAAPAANEMLQVTLPAFVKTASGSLDLLVSI